MTEPALDLDALERLAADPERAYSPCGEVMVARGDLRALIAAARERDAAVASDKSGRARYDIYKSCAKAKVDELQAALTAAQARIAVLEADAPALMQARIAGMEEAYEIMCVHLSSDKQFFARRAIDARLRAEEKAG